MGKRICCVHTCFNRGPILHRFPNPNVNLARYKLWVSLSGNTDVQSADPASVYRWRRICHQHFEERFFSSNKRLQLDAVPTLLLPPSAMKVLENWQVLMPNLENSTLPNSTNTTYSHVTKAVEEIENNDYLIIVEDNQEALGDDQEAKAIKRLNLPTPLDCIPSPSKGNQLKKNWKRDSYSKHQQSEPMYTGQARKRISHYKTWAWAERMKYFKPILKFSETELNASTGIIPNEVQNSNIEDNTESQFRLEPETTVDTTKNKRKASELSVQKSSVDPVLSYLESRNSTITDDISLTFLGYAASVKKLSSQRQTLIKLKVAELIMEAELEQQQQQEVALSCLRTRSETHTSHFSNSSNSLQNEDNRLLSTLPTYLSIK